jgi:hypothetical protein
VLGEDRNGELVNREDTTMEPSFDALAKGLANGTVSRGKALRWMGGALVGAALASVPGVAWAKPKPGKQKKCKDFEDCQGTLPGSECIKGQCVCGSGTTLCGGVCCVTESCCGGVCCGGGGQICENDVCVCEPGLTACGGGCCPEGAVCFDTAAGGEGCCGSQANVCGGVCCEVYFGALACCEGVCCGEGEVCVNGQCGCGTGPSCPAGTTCLSGTCCPGTLGGDGRYCPQGFSSDTSRNAVCCPEGTECTGSCSSISQTCNTQCCPLERICGQNRTECCPEGTICSQGACV